MIALFFFLRADLIRVPDGCDDVLFRIVNCGIVIDGDQLAIRPLNCSGISQIPTAAIITQMNLVFPRFPVVRTESGTDPIGN